MQQLGWETAVKNRSPRCHYQFSSMLRNKTKPISFTQFNCEAPGERPLTFKERWLFRQLELGSQSRKLRRGNWPPENNSLARQERCSQAAGTHAHSLPPLDTPQYRRKAELHFTQNAFVTRY